MLENLGIIEMDKYDEVHSWWCDEKTCKLRPNCGPFSDEDSTFREIMQKHENAKCPGFQQGVPPDHLIYGTRLDSTKKVDVESYNKDVQAVNESIDSKQKKVNGKKKDVPDVKKKTKGMIGNVFVESILLNGSPCFLTNVDGEIKIRYKIVYDGVIYAPLEKDEVGYFPYDFSEKQLESLLGSTITKQEILDSLKVLVGRYIDTNEINKHLILGDLLLSYSQDWIETVHFDFFVGETESGKSSGLHLFRRVGYRVLYGEDIPNADVYNFLGTDEEACGTICEDEAQELAVNREKIRTYKNSYSRGATKARIIAADSSKKRQVYYKTFCLKLFAGERIPEDKGFQERLAIIYMIEGSPAGNIKRLTDEEKEACSDLRNKILFWKVQNFHTGLPDVNTGLTKRDQELWEDYLKVMHGTSYYEKALEVVDHYTLQRHERIWNSQEAQIFRILKPLLQDNLIELEVFWTLITDFKNQKQLTGMVDKDSFILYSTGKKISRNYLAKLFIEKFHAKRLVTSPTIDGVRHQKTMYSFKPEIMEKLAVKYNLQNTTITEGSTSGLSGRSTPHVTTVTTATTSEHTKESITLRNFVCKTCNSSWKNTRLSLDFIQIQHVEKNENHVIVEVLSLDLGEATHS